MIHASPDLATVLRVERLEQQNWRRGMVSLLLLISVGLAVFAGANAPSKDTMEAKEFKLVDAEGRLRLTHGPHP
jgi:hypothetical protein